MKSPISAPGWRRKSTNEFDLTGQIEFGPDTVGGNGRRAEPDGGGDTGAVSEGKDAFGCKRHQPARQNAIGAAEFYHVDVPASDELKGCVWFDLELHTFRYDFGHVDAAYRTAQSKFRGTLVTSLVAKDREYN
jgi:hypothetical protein